MLPNVTDSDRWVRAVDAQPGVRSEVHHVLLYMADQASELRNVTELEAEDSEPGYDCWGGPRIKPGAGPGLIKEVGGLPGGWDPGAQPAELSPDLRILVPEGVTVVMQIHYYMQDADEEPQPDQTRVGLYFQAEIPKTRDLTLPILNDTFILEPRVIGKEVTAEFASILARSSVFLS